MICGIKKKLMQVILKITIVLIFTAYDYIILSFRIVMFDVRNAALT